MLTKSRINFDANASLGLLDEIQEKLFSLFGKALNPSSIHAGGQKARNLIETARDQVANSIGLKSVTNSNSIVDAHKTQAKIIFTSGASEANNCALFNPFWHKLNCQTESELVTTKVEHPCVLEPAQRLAEFGIKLKFLNVNNDASLDLSQLESLVNANTRLVSVMLANNETGQIYPVAEISKKVKMFSPATLMHSDAVQAYGKMPLNFDLLGVDTLSLSGHKIGALSGVGALVVRAGMEVQPLILGGVQEKRMRAGTENVLGIVSFGLAASILERDLKLRVKKMAEYKARLLAEIAKLPAIKINNPSQNTLPNTINLQVSGALADDLVVALDLQGLLISSGAACASGKPDASHVLIAQGLSKEQAKQSIRISFKHEYAVGEFERGVEILVGVLVKSSK